MRRPAPHFDETVLELPPGDDPARAAAEALLTRAEASFAAQFAAARDSGDLPPDADPARLGRRLQINVMGLNACAQRGGDSADLRAAAEDMAQEIEALARSVTSEAGPPRRGCRAGDRRPRPRAWRARRP